MKLSTLTSVSGSHNSVFTDSSDKIYCTLGINGLKIYTLSSGVLTELASVSDGFEYLKCFVDSAGIIYCACYEGLRIFTLSGSILTFVTQVLNDDTNAVVVDNNTNIIYVTNTFGLFVYSLSGSTLTLLDSFYDGYSSNGICIDSAGKIYVAYEGYGLRVFTFSGSLSLFASFPEGESLQEDWRDVKVDSSGKIYCACGGRGLKICSLSGSTLSILTSYDEGGSYLQVALDSEGRIYCSCNTNGFRVYLLVGDDINLLAFVNDGNPYRSVCIGSNDLIYATRNIGLIVLTLSIAEYYVDPSGSNTPPYDTKAKAANNIFTIYDSYPTLGHGDIIYLSGEITEPSGFSSYDKVGVLLIGEDPQTTIVNMRDKIFVYASARNITFIANVESDWNTAFFDPPEIINCKFDGGGYWYTAIEIWQNLETLIAGNSFENFREFGFIYSDNEVLTFIKIINNSFDNSELHIGVSGGSINSVEVYNNIINGTRINIVFTGLVVSQFCHDHNICSEEFSYHQDAVPITPDVTEIIADPLYLFTDPNNNLQIDESSPAFHFGISRPDCPSIDLLGLTFSDPPSVGAYEVLEVPPPPPEPGGPLTGFENLRVIQRFDRFDFWHLFSALLPRGPIWRIPIPNEQDIKPIGIRSCEKWGEHSISTGVTIINSVSITTGEEWGNPIVTN